MTSIACFILAFCALSSEAAYKRWISNTDFDNPYNWDKARLPCPNDRIIFPSFAPVIAINQDWTLKEMILPNDGILVLGEDINIVFNQNPTLPSDTCLNATDITYNFTTPAHWLDPSKWCLPMHDFDEVCFNDELQLHTESVPCQTDDVIFSGLLRETHRSSFYVDLNIGQDMEISSLKIGQWLYSTRIFQVYIMGDPVGRKEFLQGPGLNQPILNMTQRVCADPAGCYCGTDELPWKTIICNKVGSCPPANCQNAVVPTGHCCPICGGIIELSINATEYSVFRLTDLLRKSFIEVKGKGYEEVSFVISRLKNGNSQLTLTDPKLGLPSSNMAAEVKQVIEQDIGNSKRYGVISIAVFKTSSDVATQQPPSSIPSSSPASPPSSTKIPSVATQSEQKQSESEGRRVMDVQGNGFVVGISLLSVLVLLLLGFLLICYMTRERAVADPLSISIRFDDGEGSVNVSRGQEGSLQLQSLESDSGASVSNVKTMSLDNNNKKKKAKKTSAGFDNPIFFESKTGTLGTYEEDSSQVIGNPLYDETNAF